jgi:hypothetical protein
MLTEPILDLRGLNGNLLGLPLRLFLLLQPVFYLLCPLLLGLCDYPTLHFLLVIHLFEQAPNGLMSFELYISMIPLAVPVNAGTRIPSDVVVIEFHSETLAEGLRKLRLWEVC